MRDISLNKRILAIGLAATVLGAGIIGIPINVMAETYATSDELVATTGDSRIDQGVSVTEVTETTSISNNLGNVTTNNGTIDCNDFMAPATGTVDTNNNLISENSGRVNTNSTTGVVHNTSHGTVISNHGTVIFGLVNSSVTDNYSDGTVNSADNDYGGTITNNFGGTVGDYHLITVTNNFDSGRIGQEVSVSHQYWSVSVAEITNGSATLSGFLHKDQTDRDYLRDKDDEATDCKSGTITISPSEGHEIVGKPLNVHTLLPKAGIIML